MTLVSSQYSISHPHRLLLTGSIKTHVLLNHCLPMAKRKGPSSPAVTTPFCSPREQFKKQFNEIIIIKKKTFKATLLLFICMALMDNNI